MPYRFFTIPIRDESAADALNTFLGSHRIVAEKLEFVQDGAHSAWAVAVCYLGAHSRPAAVSDKKSKIDYREVLNEQDFRVYAKLRALRKSLAEQEGVPPYAIFTNQQLAALLEQRVTTVSAMQAIDGIGESRIKKYSSAFLAILSEEIATQTSAQSEDHET